MDPEEKRRIDLEFFMSALMDMRQTMGEIKANVETLIRTTERHGKRLLVIEITLAFATGGIILLLTMVKYFPTIQKMLAE